MHRQVRDNILMLVVATSFVVNVIFINIIPPIVREFIIVGYILLAVGASLFIAALVTLRVRGQKHVIDTGIYGIIRHPMYLGGMIMFLSHIFFGQHWVVFVSTAVAMGCCYVFMISGDERNIAKFGDDYVQYMKRVPRMNFAKGLARRMYRAK